MPSSSFLVGLAGGSASGKSTLSSQLAAALRERILGRSVEVCSTDAYFLPTGEMPTFYSPSRGKDMPDFNRPDAIDQARFLADLDARRSAPTRPDVLIVEGLMVLHIPEIRQRLDVRLFIDLEADQRALRRVVRNLEAQYGGTPREIADYYRESARVGYERFVEPSRRWADLIVRGDGDFDRTAPMLAAMIAAMVVN